MRIILIGGFLATLAAGSVYLYVLWINIGHIPGVTGPDIDWLLPQYAGVLQLAQTATFVTMVLFQLFWVWNVRDEYNPPWQTNIRESKELVVSVIISFVLTLLVVYTPLSTIFGTVPIDSGLWFLIIGVSLIGFLTPIYLLSRKMFQESISTGKIQHTDHD